MEPKGNGAYTLMFVDLQRRRRDFGYGACYLVFRPRGRGFREIGEVGGHDWFCVKCDGGRTDGCLSDAVVELVKGARMARL